MKLRRSRFGSQSEEKLKMTLGIPNNDNIVEHSSDDSSQKKVKGAKVARDKFGIAV